LDHLHQQQEGISRANLLLLHACWCLLLHWIYLQII
jgi:hypothetical protein